MTTSAIEVQGLQKSYGRKTVLDAVDLTVSAGTVTALLGPNGAGRTTTVHIAGSAGGTATTVAMDMTEGITARFRTMAISRAAVLAGHVLGNTIQVLLALVLVLGVGLLIGFRPTTGPVDWLAAVGPMALIAYAVSWLGVALGMQAKSVETASNWPLLVTFLPFLGSGFVPTGSMPVGLQWFAQYQPFTPFIETSRGLLLGTPLGSSPLLAIGWGVVITVAGFAWSMAIY